MEKTWEIREKELRQEIGNAIESMDISDAKDLGADAYLVATMTRLTAASIARSHK